MALREQRAKLTKAIARIALVAAYAAMTRWREVVAPETGAATYEDVRQRGSRNADSKGKGCDFRGLHIFQSFSSHAIFPSVFSNIEACRFW